MCGVGVVAVAAACEELVCGGGVRGGVWWCGSLSSVVTYNNRLNWWPSAVDCNDDDNDGGDSDGNGTAKVTGTAKAMVVALAATNTTIN